MATVELANDDKWTFSLAFERNGSKPVIPIAKTKF